MYQQPSTAKLYHWTGIMHWIVIIYTPGKRVCMSYQRITVWTVKGKYQRQAKSILILKGAALGKSMS